MAIIEDGTGTGSLLTVDATSKAGRVTLYDAFGNVLAPSNRGAITALTGGQLLAGNDYKIARTLRTDETGILKTSNNTLFLYDNCEGSAYDSNKWIQTITTSTVTQSAVTGMLFNANSTLTATTGALHTSHRQFPVVGGATLFCKFNARPTTHVANGVIEMGFGAPASATALNVTNGVHWRKDTGGQWLPVICVNGTEYLGTPISNATFIASVPVTDYAIFTIELREALARFCIYKNDGTLVTSQDMDWAQTGTGVVNFSVTHTPVFMRQWNNGTVVTTAVQLFVKNVVVKMLDLMAQKDYAHSQSGMGYSFIELPTTYLQSAKYVNNTLPTAFAPSNTAISAGNNDTLGGQFLMTAMATGTAVDLILCAFQIPAPYTFYFTGIRIGVPINLGAVIATTATVLTYGMAFNSSAVSLATGAPYTPMRVALGGAHSGAVGVVIGGVYAGSDITWQPQTPVAVQPTRFIHVILKCMLGTATASQTIFSGVTIDGYWE